MGEDKLVKISSTSFIKSDLFLSLLIIVIFILLCYYLYITILVNEYGSTFKPMVYLFF